MRTYCEDERGVESVEYLGVGSLHLPVMYRSAILQILLFDLQRQSTYLNINWVSSFHQYGIDFTR